VTLDFAFRNLERAFDYPIQAFRKKWQKFITFYYSKENFLKIKIEPIIGFKSAIFSMKFKCVYRVFEDNPLWSI